MEMVGIRLFLVYFWQMESVMVYVCGLPSVDPRVFQSTIIPTICCLFYHVLERCISPCICQPSLFRIALPLLVSLCRPSFLDLFLILNSTHSLLVSSSIHSHSLSDSIQSQSEFVHHCRRPLLSSSCPAVHDVFVLMTQTCVKFLDVSTCTQCFFSLYPTP